MPNALSIGRNIQSVRKEAGMTQRVVAEAAGISISQLSSYENGKQMPGLVTLGKLAVAMNSSLDRLYFGSPSEAFLNETEDFGETVVNCFIKLKELGVVKDVRSGTNGEGSASPPRCSYELSRLFSELRGYEWHKDYYPDGDAYVAQIRRSVANEINARRERRHMHT